jgi:hypothetical protein
LFLLEASVEAGQPERIVKPSDVVRDFGSTEGVGLGVVDQDLQPRL